MPTLTILHFPDPRLRKIAKPVANVNGKTNSLVNGMLETMYEAPGIGLAAPQVDAHKRIIVIDISEEKNSPLVFINPQIITTEGNQTLSEGCLSVPGFFEDVDRAANITVSALNQKGEEFTMDAEGILAVCIQHETDHLEGKLFVDYISSLKRQRIRSKMEKSKRQRKSA